MKKALSLAFMGMAITAAVAQAEIVYDFVPEVKNISFAEEYDQDSNKMVDEVKIEVNFPTDVWWVEGYASQCYLLDSKGEKYDAWWPEFWGSGSDYTRMVFEVRGLDKYVDADYTLVMPQGLFGDDTWNANHEDGRMNPELRYEFNEWKLAGEPAAPAGDMVYDFKPLSASMMYQQAWDSDKDMNVNEVRIDLQFSTDVYWASAVASQSYLMDANGEKYEGEWWLDYGGPSSDYTIMYLCVRGLSQYVDADYTLVVPEGLIGDLNWYYDSPGARTNPELRYEFNEWKLAGCPRENFTTYDFAPLYDSYSLEEVRINGQRQLELQLALEFPEAVAIYDDVKNKMSVWSAEGEYLQAAILRTWVDESNPNKVIVGLRGVDLKTPASYTISIWEGAFGTLEWAAEDYCESHSNPALRYDVSTDPSAVETVGIGEDAAAVYNLQGVRVDSANLSKGIYVRGGKKVIVK